MMKNATVFRHMEFFYKAVFSNATVWDCGFKFLFIECHGSVIGAGSATASCEILWRVPRLVMLKTSYGDGQHPFS